MLQGNLDQLIRSSWVNYFVSLVLIACKLDPYRKG